MEAGEWGKAPMADGFLTCSERRAGIYRTEATWETILGEFPMGFRVNCQCGEVIVLEDVH